MPQDLTGEERVPAGLSIHIVSERDPVVAEFVSGHRLQQRDDVGIRQTRERGAVESLLAVQLGECVGECVVDAEVGVAVRPHDEEAQPVAGGERVAQKEQRRRLRPVEVVEHE